MVVDRHIPEVASALQEMPRDTSRQPHVVGISFSEGVVVMAAEFPERQAAEPGQVSLLGFQVLPVDLDSGLCCLGHVRLSPS